RARAATCRSRSPGSRRGRSRAAASSSPERRSPGVRRDTETRGRLRRMAVRLARGFALLALAAAAHGSVALAKDDPARGRPAGKTAGEQRVALLAALDGERGAAAKARDAVAAQVIDEVRALLAGDAPVSAAAPVSEEAEPKPWLDAAWRRVGPHADRLAESADPALPALGGM